MSAPADVLGPSLLGCTLVRRLDDGTRLAGVIVETEAYLGAQDRAAHSFGNRRTDRTEPMFGPGGMVYVYLSYGVHRCMNVAASTEGDPQAVLIRALEPTENVELMIRSRMARSSARSPASLPEHRLCSGPGRLCQALAIELEHSGLMLDPDGPLHIEARPPGWSDETSIVRSGRIGLGEVGEWKHRELRFFLSTSRAVSGGRVVPADG
ncbi:MAG: DNA-3-methyladenine glycosylase [Phycisphaerales bacterium]